MRIKQIVLNEEELPTSVLAELSARELLYLAKLTGRQSGNSADELLAGSARTNSEVYEATSGIFNRFYDDGVADAVRQGLSE